MRQYRGTMARLITEDVLHKLADPEPLWVGVDDDDDVHNLVLADDDHMYYVELTIRRKSRNDEEDAP